MWLFFLQAAWGVNGPVLNLWVAEYLRLVSEDGSSCCCPVRETEASQAAGMSGASAEANIRTLMLEQAIKTEHCRHMPCFEMMVYRTCWPCEDWKS